MGIIVGSKALEYWGLARRPPQDIDMWVISIPEESPGADSPRTDYYQVSEEILKLVHSISGYAIPDAVYTIKLSHMVYDIHWDKTKLDVLWLKSRRCVVMRELYNALCDLWKKEYGDKDFLSLRKSKEYFFTDHVTYTYDHDYLHELVSFPKRPLYESVLKDGEEVLVSREKFESLEFQDKLKLFREEITVIACERWVLNPYYKGSVSWYKAYFLALKKVVVSLTKGWASQFIVCNIDYFNKPMFECFEHLLKTLKVEMMDGQKLIEEMREEFDCIDSSLHDFVEEILEGQCLVEQEGGSEYCCIVWKYKDEYYRGEYSYYSHQGYDYDNFEDSICEVSPVKKTVTVYE